jgi:serine/threonine protein kinase
LQSRFPDLPGRRLERWLDRSGLGRVALAHNLTSRVQEVIKLVLLTDCSALLRGSEPSPRADFFSVGVMFREMLLGMQPRERTVLPTTIPLLPITLSPLQSCLDKLLAIDPEARFSCGEDVIAALIAVRNTSSFDFGQKK